jgi:tetratricopeptide (TPR) repeat protein
MKSDLAATPLGSITSHQLRTWKPPRVIYRFNNLSKRHQKGERMLPLEKKQYHVFLSYSNSDRTQVEEIARRLLAVELKPFFDKWSLIPGNPWQEALEEALDNSETCAVFLGPSGLGPWQNEEVRSALDNRLKDKTFRVIPVLLPGANSEDEETLPKFLSRLTWVEFHAKIDEQKPFDNLVAGIRGEMPGPGKHAPGGILYDVLKDLDRAVRLNPNDAMAYFNRGKVHSDRGDIERAMADFDQALRLKPELVEVYCARGDIYYKKGRYKLALGDYNRAVKLDPDEAAAYRGRGDVYCHYNEDSWRALDDYNKAIKLAPGIAASYRGRGNARLKRGEYDLAISDYSRAIEITSNDAAAYCGRGEAYRKKREYGLAIADYDKALELDPSFVAAYRGRANTRLNKEEHDLALADYDRAVELDPADPVSYCERGKARCKRGDMNVNVADLENGIEDFEHAIKLNPEDAKEAYNGREDAYFTRAVVYFREKEYERSLVDFSRFPEDSSKYLIVRATMGIACYQVGDYDRAIYLFSGEIQDRGRFIVAAHYYRGLCYCKKGADDDAIVDYDKSIDLAPDYAAAYLQRGIVYEKKGDKSKANADFQKCSQIADDSDIRKLADEGLHRLGKESQDLGH